jgi:hypothetical protein
MTNIFARWPCKLRYSANCDDSNFIKTARSYSIRNSIKVIKYLENITDSFCTELYSICSYIRAEYCDMWDTLIVTSEIVSYSKRCVRLAMDRSIDAPVKVMVVSV